MTPTKISLGLMAIWALVYTASFIAFHVTEPTGDGFLRGANRLVNFLGFQAGALIPAFSLSILGHRHGAFMDPKMRRALHMPLIVSLLSWVTFAAVLGWISYAG